MWSISVADLRQHAEPFRATFRRQKEVDAVLHGAKDRLLDMYLTAAEEAGLAPHPFFASFRSLPPSGDDMGLIAAYLRLDLDVYAALPESLQERISLVVDDAEREMHALLTAAEREMFADAGIRSLLASHDFPLVAEFLERVNDDTLQFEKRGDYSELFCDKPFTTAEVAQEGRTYLCCPLQLPDVVGDAKDGDFMTVWNSEKAQAIRRSILDGTFSHCREKTCGALQSRSLPRRDAVDDPYLRLIIDHKITKMPRGPTSMTMNYDRSCNLACPTCRNQHIGLKGQAREDALAIQRWATDPKHLDGGAYLHFTGSGDAFASTVFQSFLQEFDATANGNVRFGLGTNGLLLNERTWDRIANCSVDTLCISMDAATAETYALNRGGDFGVLLENLDFVRGLRRDGKLKLFIINFVVQANNFREMPQFAALGARLGCDMVFFQQIVNWGTFTRKEFAARAVHRPSHPEYLEFLDVLRDPALAAAHVNLHNLSSLLQQAVAASDSIIPTTGGA